MLRIWLCMALLALCLAGCSDEETTYETTTLIVNEDGTITEVVVEAFDKEYYDAAEMENFAKSEVQDYNYKKLATQIIVDSAEVVDNQAKVTISYKTSDDYTAFNEQELFVGTVREAMDAGYTFDKNFTKYGKDEMEPIVKVTENAGYGIVITSLATDVVLPDKIVYISDNVSTESKKRAATADNDSCYIIYKK